MKDLQELVELVNRNKLKRIDLLDLQDGADTKVIQLYKAISEGKVIEDRQAKDLFLTEGQSPAAYTNLKTALRTKLLNALFFIDVDKRKYTDRQAAIFSLQKELAAAQLLHAKGAGCTAIGQYERCLKTALRFEFVEAVVVSSRALRIYYGTRNHQPKKYELYCSLYDEYALIDQWENLAEAHYANLMSEYQSKKMSTAQLQQLAFQYYEELTTQLDQITTYKFRLYTTLIEFLQHTLENDYIAVIPKSEIAISFFENKHYAAHTAIQLCLHHQLVGFLQLGDYASGFSVGRRSQALITKGSNNWFNNLEYLLLLALHTDFYQDAYLHYLEATQNSRFKNQPELTKGMWGIYRAYLHFLVRQRKVQPLEKERAFSPQKFKRFLNGKLDLSKDKQGMNVAIQIIHIFFYLQDQEYDTARTRLEALYKYSSRHLGDDASLRPHRFIRLLMTLNRGNFERKRVLRLAVKPLASLNETAGKQATPFHKMEVIPFEKMWEMALDLLVA